MLNRFSSKLYETTTILTEFSFIIALNMFLSQGFSILILKDTNSRIEKSISQSSYIMSLVGILLLYIMHYICLVSQFFLNSLFFLCMIGYYNLRNRLIKKQRFLILTIIELVYLIMFLSSIIFINIYSIISAEKVYLCFIIPLIILTLVDLIYSFKTVIEIKLIIENLKQAILIGATNVLTGGVAWLLPKVSEKIFLPNQISIIVNIAFLLGLVRIMPRALINSNLKAVNSIIDKKDLKSLLSLNKKLTNLLYFLFPIVIFISYFYLRVVINVEVAPFYELIIIILLASFVGLQSQLNLINSTILTLMRENIYTLKYNLIYGITLFISFVIIIGLSLLFSPSYHQFLIFIFYSLTLICINYRNSLLKKRTYISLKFK